MQCKVEAVEESPREKQVAYNRTRKHYMQCYLKDMLHSISGYIPVFMYGPISNCMSIPEEALLCTVPKWTSMSLWAECKIQKLCSQNRPMKTNRRPWAILFQQKSEEMNKVELWWDFRTATSGYWSILVPVSKKYDKAGKRFSQSTDLLGQVSFSCLASPFVFVSLSSWYLTKVHNDGQLLTTQKGLVLVRGPSPFLHSTEVSTPLWIPSLEPTSTSTHAAPHSCLANCLKITVLGTVCSITKLKPALSNRLTDRQCCISSGRANVTLPRRAEHPLPGTPTSHNWGHYVQKPGSILYHPCRLPPSCSSWQYAFFSLLGGSVGDWSTPTRLHWGTPGNEDVFCESGFTK